MMRQPQIIEMIVLSPSVVCLIGREQALTHRGGSAISDIRGTLASAHHHPIIISRRKSFRHQKRQDKKNIRHQKRQDKKNIRHQSYFGFVSTFSSIIIIISTVLCVCS